MTQIQSSKTINPFNTGPDYIRFYFIFLLAY